MVTRRLWWAAAALLALGACDSPQVGTDGGDEDGGTDACEGLTLCTTAGTSCRGDSVVTCAANADGCMVETTAACAADETCEVSGGAAECVEDVVDPCEGVPAAERCTAEGRSCDGDTLSICAANTDGCLVIEETDCAAGAGVCDESGTMPMCVFPVDPCDGIADACTTPGTSCDGDNLVTCAPNAFGCLVATTADCASRAGGTCDDTATAECTFTGDPCDGITQCAAAGVSCDGPELVACAEDAFGCLVEARTDCTDAMFGFCADGAPAMCSTAATDPCMGLTQCGTEATRACSGDDSAVETCAPNAFGCFVTESTTCDTGDVCSDAGEMAVCVDVCSLVRTCPSATYCDGNEVVTCEADTNGCLVETTRAACAATETCDPAGTAACATTMCPEAVPGFINCDSGTVSGDTAMGSDVNDGRYGGSPCADSTSWNGMEQFWRFRNDDATPMEVTILATRGASTADFDLFVVDGANACSSTTQACLAGSMGTTSSETVRFVAEPGQLAHVVYDVWNGSAATTDYTLEITCTPIVCGDGVVSAGEECEDGNTAPGDGCSDTCQQEPGWDCTDAIPAVCTFLCGNGTIDSSAGETCDDGGVVPGDGCSATCGIEAGWGCSGTPSVCFELADNWSCATATALTAAGVTGVDLSLGGARPTGTGCSAGTGPVLFYSVTIPANSETAVTATPTGSPSWDITLRSLADCSSGACLATVDVGGSGAADTIRLPNATGAAITRIIAVGGWVPTVGTFDLSVANTPLAANAGCAGATPVSANATITGEDLAGGGPRPSGTGCGGGTGNRVLYYSVSVPTNTRVDVTTTRTGPSTGPDLVLFTQDACSDTNCTASSDNPERLAFSNTSAATVTRIVGIRGLNSTTTGTFDVAFAYTTLAANAGCAGAVPMGAGVTGADLGTGGPRPTGTNCASSAGPVLYYSVQVPADSTTTVTATATGTTWDPTLRSVADCSGSCLQHRDASGGVNETISFTNTTSSPVTRVFAVGADSTTNYGTFDLSAASTPITYAANSTCATATVIDTATPSVTAQNTSGGGTSPSGATCESSGSQTLYYAVTVPAGQEARVEVDGATGFDAVVMLLDSCGAADCASSTDGASSGGSEFVTIDNSIGTAPITRILAVNDWSGVNTGSFDVEATFRTPAPNATCAGATAVSATTSFDDVDVGLGGAPPAGTSCANASFGLGGPSVYYAVTVPPTTRVTVTVSRVATIDSVVRVLDACGSPCSSVTDEETSDPEVVQIDNTGASPITRIVSVNDYRSTTGGVADIAFTYAPIP